MDLQWNLVSKFVVELYLKYLVILHYIANKINKRFQAIAWHPWKSTFLAIGLGYNEGRVVLYNVSTHKLVAAEDKVYPDSSVDALAFNPITAELVVSYYVQRPGSRAKGCGIITVMSNFNNIVEELHIHSGPIPYLLWGRDGKSLGIYCSNYSKLKPISNTTL